ncbi:quercetin dioxygenase-like cupin family protein [Mucilaginibacter sp. UYNi724]
MNKIKLSAMKITNLISVLLICASTTQLHAQTTDKNAAPIKENLTTSHHTILEQALPSKAFKNKSVEMLIVDLPPLSTSIAHRHPYPTFGYVVSGEIASVFEGKKHVYKAGDSFYETPQGLHSGSWNESATVPAKLLVFYVKEKNKTNYIPEKK